MGCCGSTASARAARTHNTVVSASSAGPMREVWRVMYPNGRVSIDYGTREEARAALVAARGRGTIIPAWAPAPPAIEPVPTADPNIIEGDVISIVDATPFVELEATPAESD